MIQRVRSIVLIAGAIALASVLGACSSGDDDVEVVTTELTVTLNNGGCDPHNFGAPAGTITFVVSNTSSTTVTTFQLLDEEDVIGEAKEVEPGVTKTFTRELDPGTYAVACPGGTAFPLGTLTVTG